MASLAHIMLNGNENFNGWNFKSWKHKMLAIFEYKCLDKHVLGKEVWSEIDVDAQAEYDVKNREAMMWIKLLVMNEILPTVHARGDAFTIWQYLEFA